jgi:hypothetical protein
MWLLFIMMGLHYLYRSIGHTQHPSLQHKRPVLKITSLILAVGANEHNATRLKTANPLKAMFIVNWIGVPNTIVGEISHRNLLHYYYSIQFACAISWSSLLTIVCKTSFLQYIWALK